MARREDDRHEEYVEGSRDGLPVLLLAGLIVLVLGGAGAFWVMRSHRQADALAADRMAAMREQVAHEAEQATAKAEQEERERATRKAMDVMHAVAAVAGGGWVALGRPR